MCCVMRAGCWRNWTISTGPNLGRLPKAHTGTSIQGGEGCDDAAVSALYLSKVMPGHYFVVRANAPATSPSRRSSEKVGRGGVSRAKGYSASAQKRPRGS